MCKPWKKRQLLRAFKLAIESVDKEIQRISVDANLHEKYKADYPAARNNFARREKLRETRQVLHSYLEALEQT